MVRSAAPLGVPFAILITRLTSPLVDILTTPQQRVSTEGAFSDFRQATVVAMAAVPPVVLSLGERRQVADLLIHGQCERNGSCCV